MECKNKPVLELASLRKEIITYLEPLPQLIKTNGPASLGYVALSLGKCLAWIGPTLDRYTLVQPLPGTSLPLVAELGDQLRVIGLDIIQNPGPAEIKRIVSALNRQAALLETLAGKGGAS